MSTYITSDLSTDAKEREKYPKDEGKDDHTPTSVSTRTRKANEWQQSKERICKVRYVVVLIFLIRSSFTCAGVCQRR